MHYPPVVSFKSSIYQFRKMQPRLNIKLLLTELFNNLHRIFPISVIYFRSFPSLSFYLFGFLTLIHYRRLWNTCRRVTGTLMYLWYDKHIRGYRQTFITRRKPVIRATFGNANGSCVLRPINSTGTTVDKFDEIAHAKNRLTVSASPITFVNRIL